MRGWLKLVGMLVLAGATYGCPTTPPPPPPPPIHFVTMGWDDMGAAVVEYGVYRGASPDVMALLGTTTLHSYVDRQVQTKATYYYRVTSRDASGAESGFSNVITATVP